MLFLIGNDSTCRRVESEKKKERGVERGIITNFCIQKLDSLCSLTRFVRGTFPTWKQRRDTSFSRLATGLALTLRWSSRKRLRSCHPWFLFLGISMIPAGARWVYRLYLPTTNCSSFNQLAELLSHSTLLLLFYFCLFFFLNFHIMDTSVFFTRLSPPLWTRESPCSYTSPANPISLLHTNTYTPERKCLFQHARSNPCDLFNRRDRNRWGESKRKIAPGDISLLARIRSPLGI